MKHAAPQPASPPSLGGTVVRWLLTLGLLALVGLLTDRLAQMQGRLEDLESARLDEAHTFQSNLHGVQQELSSIRGELESSASTAELATLLSERLRTVEGELGEIGQEIQVQADSLTELVEEQESFGPDVLQQELARRDEELRSRLESRYQALNELVSNVEATARASRQQVERLEAELVVPRDLGVMWRDLVGPVVQLAGDSSVGSGVLLESEELPDGGYRTYLLTAWHVVRDIQGDLSKTDLPVPVFVYDEDGTIDEEAAELLVFDADLDAALLVLYTPVPFENGARLASREQLAQVRIFDQVVAVGCPLGNDPIPTRGEVATTKHMVDGEWYWMLNAPTYIGNSGGGIFADQSHELLAIFSKIYTHGTLRPTIVPHMGLATPLTSIYDWLELSGYGEVVPNGVDSARVAAASVGSRD